MTPDAEGIFIAEAYVQTQHELIQIPFRLRTADGTLNVVPSTILLDDAFPVSVHIFFSKLFFKNLLLNINKYSQ